jgi:hypothetical protein
VLSPKTWKIAGRTVEPLGWFDPFADRFPDMENSGKGRDFTRVPAKFPNITQAQRDENFRLWLDEKNQRTRDSRALQRERAQSGGDDFFSDSVGRSSGGFGADTGGVGADGLTPAQRRGDPEADTPALRRAREERQRAGRAAHAEWVERKRAMQLERRRHERAKVAKWEATERAHHQDRLARLAKKKVRILEFREIQERRKKKGPPGHKKRKNPLAGGGKAGRKRASLRPVSAAHTGALIALQKKEAAAARPRTAASAMTVQERTKKRLRLKALKRNRLNSDEVHHLYRLSVSPLIMPPERPPGNKAVKPKNGAWLGRGHVVCVCVCVCGGGGGGGKGRWLFCVVCIVGLFFSFL